MSADHDLDPDLHRYRVLAVSVIERALEDLGTIHEEYARQFLTRDLWDDDHLWGSWVRDLLRPGQVRRAVELQLRRGRRRAFRAVMPRADGSPNFVAHGPARRVESSPECVAGISGRNDG